MNNRADKADKEGKQTRNEPNDAVPTQAEQDLRQALLEKEHYNERLRKEVEQAAGELLRARRKSTAMFESNPYVNVLFDDRLRVADCNPAALDYFGFETRERFLKDFLTLLKRSIPPRQSSGRASIPLRERLMTAMSKGVAEFETELIIRDRRAPMNVIMKRIPYEDSFAIVCYMIDMSELKEAERELLDHERLLSAVNEVAGILLESEQTEFEATVRDALGVFGLCVEAYRVALWVNEPDENGDIYSVRAASWAAEGVPEIHRNGTKILLNEYVPEWAQAPRPDLNRPMTQMSSAHRNFVDNQRTKSSLLIPLHIHGEFWGFITFSHGEENHLFNERQRAILRAGGVLIASAMMRNETMKALIETREHALASMRAKSDFLARMSHEIRTPMNAIIGMTALAEKTDDIEKIRHCLSKVDSSSRQLLGIINDVLDMSKIDANKLEIVENEFDFTRMLENVVNVIQVKLDEKRQTLRFDIERAFLRNMISDELRLSQVLLNLLSNAVKFTPECGDIVLKIRTSPMNHEYSKLRVEVIDNGIGMTEAQQAQIFNSFEQADGTITRQYGGTGLGLAISRRIVDLMGGDIWVESSPGEGARFIFEIDVAWGERRDASKKKDALREHLKILVVDDQPDVLAYFSSILAGFSLSAETAENGARALDMVRRGIEEGEPYDVIFLDWYMPNMGGGETARQILALMHDNVIVVMISSADWNDIRDEAACAGVRHFLPKPVFPSTLYDTIVQLTDETLTTSDGDADDTGLELAGRTILLAEDIEVNREIVAGILEDTHVSIDMALDGAQAVEMFRAHPERYDLILMDVQMPVMDGMTATRAIRASGLPRAATVPIVAMTANAFKEDVQASLDAGMNGHLAKPIDVPEMFRVLKDTILPPGNEASKK